MASESNALANKGHREQRLNQEDHVSLKGAEDGQAEGSTGPARVLESISGKQGPQERRQRSRTFRATGAAWQCPMPNVHANRPPRPAKPRRGRSV